MIDIKLIETADFEILKEIVDSWDLSKISEYNLPNWEEDDLLVLRQKIICIYKQLFT